MNNTDQELEIGKLNENYFFREFTFSTTNFTPSSGTEVELADGLVWLGETAIVFQLKERGAVASPSVKSESTWFDNKVIRKGAKQIRDTVGYLNAGKRIEIISHSGHRLGINGSDLTTLHKVICFRPHPVLPDEALMRKCHESDSVGIIHLIPERDYHGVVRTLLTPSEVFEYLEFREELIDRWGARVDAVPEQALVGHYICGDAESPPSIEFMEYLRAVDHGIEEWDVSGLIIDFPGSMKDGVESADYRAIVSEIAKLKRNELAEFKKRYLIAVKKCREGVSVKPYCFGAARTGCAFVFVPVEEECRANSRLGLTNYTLACKYHLKCDRCIGISFIPEKYGFYSADWCYIAGAWVYDEVLERLLTEDRPFRRTRTVASDRYRFRDV